MKVLRPLCRVAALDDPPPLLLSADDSGQFSLTHVSFMTQSEQRAESENFPKLKKQKEKK